MTVKPFYIRHTPDMTDAQVAEIFDKAVACGAQLGNGVKGFHSNQQCKCNAYLPGEFKYFGVTKSNKTWISDVVGLFGEEITLDQVDEWLGIAPKPVGNFPNFDFKIDCGDDQKVRQWLHDNGGELAGGKSVLIMRNKKYATVRKKIVRCCLQNYFENECKLPLINPYDYMQPAQPTVAERMAALIEEYRDLIPNNCTYVAIGISKQLMAFTQKPEPSSRGWNLLTAERMFFISSELNGFDVWRETLTELPRNLTQEEPIANEQLPQRDVAYEMILADRREMSPQEREWMLKHVASEQATTVKQLPMLPTEQAMPMMFGGDFGCVNDD